MRTRLFVLCIIIAMLSAGAAAAFVAGGIMSKGIRTHVISRTFNEMAIGGEADRCVKPVEIKIVLNGIFKHIKNNCHIVSLNGSVLFKQLEQICINKKISKVIPSVTAEINQSVTLTCHNNFVGNENKNELKKLLESFGTVIEIPEIEMGMGSELTSCIPGFYRGNI